MADASQTRRLLFSYTSGLMTSVEFQILVLGAWTTYHTTTYGYTSGYLTTVSMGSSTIQTNSYTGNYLTTIEDGEGNNLVSFVYDSSTAGQVVRVDTPRGMVGYEYGSSRTSCSGETVLYFHLGNTTSCDVDADCGSGFLCGGKSGSGSTGACFRAARCLTIDHPSEDVVTTVSAIGPPGETCDGACLDAAEYIWDTASGALDLTAVQDPSSYYTVKKFDANGMPTKIVYGDVDTNPDNGNGQREVYLFYDTDYPGKLSEVRRPSELSEDASRCSDTITAGCARSVCCAPIS